MAKKILDVGCGTDPKPDATHFLDINPAHIKGKKNGKVWDLNKLPLPHNNNTFDKIYCDNVLEHLDVNTEDVLSELYRILKHRGTLVVAVPNAMWWYDRILYLLGKMPNDFILAHKKHFTRDYISIALRNCGFKIVPHHNKSLLFKPKFIGKEISIIARKVE